MATAADIFNHDSPNVFPDEAPLSSGEIGKRILNEGFAYVDAIIRAKYGAAAGIPNGMSDTRQVLNAGGAMTPNLSGSSTNVVLLLIALVVLFLIFRR